MKNWIAGIASTPSMWTRTAQTMQSTVHTLARRARTHTLSQTHWSHRELGQREDERKKITHSNENLSLTIVHFAFYSLCCRPFDAIWMPAQTHTHTHAYDGAKCSIVIQNSIFSPALPYRPLSLSLSLCWVSLTGWRRFWIFQILCHILGSDYDNEKYTTAAAAFTFFFLVLLSTHFDCVCVRVLVVHVLVRRLPSATTAKWTRFTFASHINFFSSSFFANACDERERACVRACLF